MKVVVQEVHDECTNVPTKMRSVDFFTVNLSPPNAWCKDLLAVSDFKKVLISGVFIQDNAANSFAQKKYGSSFLVQISADTTRHRMKSRGVQILREVSFQRVQSAFAA